MIHETLKYSITCLQRPINGSNKSGFLQQMVFKYRFLFGRFQKRCFGLEQWSSKAMDCLIHVVSNTGITVYKMTELNIY